MQQFYDLTVCDLQTPAHASEERSKQGSPPIASDDQRGAVLVFMAFALIVVLAVGGLAIDAGNLFRVQVLLQNAADAGALSGLTMTIVEDQHMDIDSEKDLIIDRAEQVALENLNAVSITPSSGPTAVVNAVARTINVQITADIDFLLLDLVPFQMLGLDSPAQVSITTSAGTKRKEAHVALILDYSNSMECPSSDPTAAGYCKCLTQERTAETCEEEALRVMAPNTGRRKFEDLNEAVEDFVDHFDEERDRISLITFNTVAKLRVPVNQHPDGNGRTFVKQDITDALVAAATELMINADGRIAGSTNVSDGFITAYQDMHDKGIVGNKEIAYVYFSDGAPTAGRFLFPNSDTHNTLEGNAYVQDEGTNAPGLRDYIHYTVQWVVPANPVAQPPRPVDTYSYAGPSHFVKKSDLLDISNNFYPGYFTHAAIGGTTPFPPPYNQAPASPPAINDFLPSCMLNVGQAHTLPLDDPNFTSDDGNYQTFFERCFSANMGFHMPNEPPATLGNLNDQVYGEDYNTGKMATSWREQYANAAIQLSEFVRSKGGTVFVLGLGKHAGLSCDGTESCDPTGLNCCTSQQAYQNTEDTLSQKDVFLTRMANDCSTFMNPPTRPDNPFPNFGFDGYSNCDPKSIGQGDFYSALTPEQLDELFKAIAQKILLQLTS